MTDIVERLRNSGIKHPQQLEHWRDEAVDEIEHLRQELAKCQAIVGMQREELKAERHKND